MISFAVLPAMKNIGLTRMIRQGSPIAGYILNASGGEAGGIGAYRPAIFYAGSMATAATVLAGIVRIKVDRRLKKTV